MSLVFSEPTNKTGAYELFQDLTGTNTDSYPKAKFTRDFNNALAYYNLLAIKGSGGQADDTNHPDYNIIKLDIVSGQRDYPITVDGSVIPNQILDILRVEAKDAAGVARDLPAYNAMAEEGSLVQALTQTGTPTRQSKLANGFFLDPTPNYSYAEGLWIYISRTPSYFLSTDTTKKPGIPDMFHEFLVYRCAYLYCVTKLPNLANGYFNILTQGEKDIANYFFWRNRDEKKGMSVRRANNR